MKKIRLLPLIMTSFLIVNIAFAADEIHWTITGQDSVTFDWRGTAQENSIGYGLSPGVYTQTTAQSPDPVPSSSQGPFWEAKLTGLKENTRYYYSIGNGPERTFHTAPYRGSSDFTIYAQGNIGDTGSYFNMGVIQDLIANDRPAFVIGLGDLTLGSNNGKAAVDQHFNDVMTWSKEAAYMPVWGALDWSGSSTDSFNNYKGRFDVPNSQTSPGSPLAGGKDWYWFDYGNTRFITLPEPWSGAWSAWNTKADALMAQAQADPDIKYIVTFAHQPAYSSGHYTGSATLRGMLDTLGDTHSKYVLNVNAHSVNYERSHPQHGVVHITAGIGGANLEQDDSCLWLTCSQPSWSAYRAMHQGALKLHFTGSGIEGSFICGPAGGGSNDVNCIKGSVVDKFMIGSPAVAPSESNSLASAVASAEPVTTSIAPMTVRSAPMMRASTSTTTNLLGNPGFEGGATTWVQSGSVISNSTSQPPRSGTWKADLNGFGYVSTESFYQTVTIPATVTSATLSFWLHIDTAETTTSTAYDKLSVQVQNSSGTVLNTLATYSNLNKNTGYVQKSFDLSSYKGQTIRLSIKGTEDYSLKTSFVLDDFVLGEGSTPTTTPPTTTPPPTTTSGRTYYVAPSGSNSNSGTITAPFATIQKAHDVAVAGDTIYVRGGTYTPTSAISFSRSGSSSNRIKLWAYPGEVPIINGSSQPSSVNVITMNNTSWWHIKGLEIKNGAQGGIRITGAAHNNIIENNNMHHNGRASQWDGPGFALTGVGSNNLILNNDSHHNRDLQNDNADGITVSTTGSGNVLRGNRLWRNSDDGFDFFNSTDNSTQAPLLVENNWAWENGYDDNLQPLGEGAGFKLGGRRTGTYGTSGGHTVRGNLAWGNKYAGFNENSANKPLILYNNTSYNNSYNYAFWATGGTISVLKNNVSIGTLGAATAVDDTYNSWNLAVTANAADFSSMSDACARGPRQADGSLPNCSFLKLVTGSDLIDKGTPVGLPYNSTKPDLGAFEK